MSYKKVHYKRLNSDYLKGSVEVIGKDNHQINVTHGGSLIRVHPDDPFVYLVDDSIGHYVLA